MVVGGGGGGGVVVVVVEMGGTVVGGVVGETVAVGDGVEVVETTLQSTPGTDAASF